MKPVAALPTFESLAALSDEEVADELTTWGGRVAAGEARLLAYIGEFDERRAWAVSGILSCASWLSWRLGMGIKAASDRVRVARALRKLPLTFAAFTAGQLSFTQVRALTRMDIAHDEATYISLARHASGAQIERLAGGMRRARKYAENERKRAAGEDVQAPGPKATIRYDVDGDLIITLRLSAADGAVVLAALDGARKDLDSHRDAEAAKSSAEESAPRRATEGDGFLEMSKAYLRQRAKVHPSRARRDRAKLTVQVDPLSGWARLPDGELLPPQVAAQERLTLPGGTAFRRLSPADLTRYDAGRRLREPDQRLRDLLATVDGERCRYPGCTRKRRLHAHHLRHWSAGGRTDLENMVLLCGRHHTVVHAEDVRLALDPRTRVLVVRTSDGTHVPERPAPPWGSAKDLDRRIGKETLPPLVQDKLDLHYAVEVLLYGSAPSEAAA